MVYDYDALARRVRSLTTSPTGTTTTSFLLDGDRCIEEQYQGGPRDGEVRDFIHGVDIDELIAIDVSRPMNQSETYYPHADANGDVVALSDHSGNPVDQVAYDEFGVPYYRDQAQHASNGNAYLFQGLRFEDETGLYYVRARYYDPVTGRFLQRDPLGFWGDAGSYGNPYTFCGNNPATMRDPSGELIWFLAATLLITGVGAEATESPALAAMSPVHLAIQSGFGYECFTGRELSAREQIGDGIFAALAFVPGSSELEAGSVAARAALFAERAQLAMVAFDALELGANVAESDALFGTSSEPAAEPAPLAEPIPNCFLGGTLVEAERGPVAIEELSVGDRVWMSPDNGSGHDRTLGVVQRLYRNRTPSVTYVKIRREGSGERGDRLGARSSACAAEAPSVEPPSATTIRCTPGHPWFVKDKGWTVACALRAQDELVSLLGETLVVDSVETRDETACTFNIQTSLHTYFVAGKEGAPAVWVHNVSLKVLDDLARNGQTIARLEQRALRAGGPSRWRMIFQEGGREVVRTVRGEVNVIQEGGVLYTTTRKTVPRSLLREGEGIMLPRPRYGHIDISGNAASVEFAGAIRFGRKGANAGRLLSWSNASGHYLTTVEEALAPHVRLPSDLFVPHR